MAFLVRRLLLAIPTLFGVLVVAFLLLFSGYFAGPYTFANAAGFRAAALLTFGALLGFICSLVPPRRSANRKF